MSARPRPVFELQGHRGARGLFPENTLEGFAATIRLGVDSLELDVGLTRDGVPVVFHDVALSPDIVRDGTGAWITPPGPSIHTLTRAQLATYDVGRLRPGSDYSANHPAQEAIDSARIPDLEAVLSLAAASGTRLDIELKTLPHRPDLTASPIEMADRVMALIDRLGAVDRVDLRAFDWRALSHLRRTRPEVSLTWLTHARAERDHELWWGASAPADPVAAIHGQGGPYRDGTCWAPEASGLTPARLAAARGAGLRVVPWTVNDRVDMARLMAWGVDGICTDRPDIARDAMRANQLSPPPARS